MLSTMLNERHKPVYEVKTASRRVERQLDKVDNEIYPKVAKAIESLANNPRPFGVKKLAGRVHRIRVGPYRIIYSIYDHEKVVVISQTLKVSETFRVSNKTSEVSPDLRGLFDHQLTSGNYLDILLLG